MIRHLPLLLLAALAAPVRTGCTPARARVAISRLPDSQLATARCLTRGLSPPIHYLWKLGPGLTPVGAGAPRDEGAVMLAISRSAKAMSIACTAIDAAGASLSAQSSLDPISIRAVQPPSAAHPRLLTITGTGFGAKPEGDDGVYLVPLRGPALRADVGCPGAGWKDSELRACAPAEAIGRSLQIRVESGERLAIAPGPPLLLPSSERAAKK